MQRPIGVFDSGVGGLTVLTALQAQLPGEDLLYLGDTARVPYGTRSPETVVRYSLRVASRLWDEGIKALVIACNTATAHALPALQAAGAQLGMPVIGVIEPGVEAAMAVTRGRVGVIGTEGTIRAARYQQALALRGVRASGLACPLFVSLAEEGWTEGEVARLVAQRYLAPFVDGPDTVILGCTHYPLLREVIASVLPGTTLVDSAEATARATAHELGKRGLLRDRKQGGRARFLVTDNLERFHRVGERFLGVPPEGVELVDLPEAQGAFAWPQDGDPA